MDALPASSDGTPELPRRRLFGAAGIAGVSGLIAAHHSALELPVSRAAGTTQASSAAEVDEEDPLAEAVVVSSVSAVESLDPALAVDTETERVCRQVFESLIGIDRETGSTAPLLASDWTVSSDGLTYTFELQQDVTFHDGAELTAEAVAANFDRWSRLDELHGAGNLRQSVPLAFESVFGGFMGEESCVFDSAEAEDDHTLVLHLTEPVVFLPQALTLPSFGIASPDTLSDEDPGLVSRSPAGTGAYRVAQAEPGEIVLQAYDDYWNGGNAAAAELPEESAPEQVVVAAVPRSFDRLRDLQRGRIDVYDYITADNLRPLVQSGRLILQRDPFSILYLGFNLDHPVMAQSEVREAAARAVDRSGLVDRFFLEGTRTAHEFVPAALGVQSEDARRYGRNMETAQELLEESDYDGEPLSFYYPMTATRAYLPQPEAVYAAIAADLTEAGFVIRPRPVRWDQGYVEELLDDEDRAMHLLGRNGGYRSAHSFLGPLFSRSTSEFHYDNEDVRELIREARGEEDEDARGALYREISEIVAEDLPALPLAFPISGVALGRQVADYPMSPVLHELFRDIRSAV